MCIRLLHRRCKTKVAAEKSTVFEVAPNVLQLYLKRFTVRRGGWAAAGTRGCWLPTAGAARCLPWEWRLPVV